MKLLYSLNWAGNPSSGVPLKVLNQIDAWKALTIECELFVICPKSFESEWKSRTKYVLVYNNLIQHIYVRTKVAFLIIFLRRNWIIYRRYGIYLPAELLSILFNRTAIEFNTNNDFYFKEKGLFTFAYHKIQEILINSFSLCGFAVTDEIKKLQKNKIKRKILVCTNAVYLPNKQVKFIRNWKRIRILFLVSDNFSWNGMDRLLQLAGNTPLYDYFVIGPVSQKSSSINVFFLGPKFGSELDDSINTMDFGLANLNMEKVGLSEFAPLKNRKYLELGLPIISVYKDSGIPTELGFLYLLPSEIFQSGASEKILKNFDSFISKWVGKRVPIEKITNLSFSEIERLRIEHIEKIAYGGRI